jgi:hypothetical protein
MPIYFVDAEHRTQSLVYARQVLYHWITSSAWENKTWLKSNIGQHSDHVFWICYIIHMEKNQNTPNSAPKRNVY